MIAYHFVNDALRDGRPVPADGEWLEHDGELELCEAGLHASLHPFDALQYAPGNVLCLVELGGEILHGNDKVVASRRRIVKRIDAEPLMREFARWCALHVIDLWDAPEVVRQYLTTGDESLRAAAWAAAGDAAGTARDAAWAAGAAARDAAWAAGAAARDAAWAAWAAAGDAAWAAWDAAWDAAWAAWAAWDAWAAAGGAGAAWDARAAAGAAQRERFSKMVNAAMEAA